MPFRVRCIVTGHDRAGRAIVTSDGLVEARPGRRVAGMGNAFLWSTDSMPAPVAGEADPAQKLVELTPSPSGTIFRMLELPPGAEPYMHKTQTLDYVIVLSGEADMLLDDGAEVHMKAGDVMVQRATWHGWANRGASACRIAFVLIDAHKAGSTP